MGNCLQASGYMLAYGSPCSHLGQPMWKLNFHIWPSPWSCTSDIWSCLQKGQLHAGLCLPALTMVAFMWCHRPWWAVWMLGFATIENIDIAASRDFQSCIPQIFYSIKLRLTYRSILLVAKTHPPMVQMRSLWNNLPIGNSPVEYLPLSVGKKNKIPISSDRPSHPSAWNLPLLA